MMLQRYVTKQKGSLLLFRYYWRPPSIVIIGRHNHIKHKRSFSLSNNNNNEKADDWIYSLPSRYLREVSSSEYDPITMQRIHVAFDSDTGKPVLLDAATNNNKDKYTIVNWSFCDQENTYKVDWGDGTSTQYSKNFLHDEVSAWRWRQQQQQSLQQQPTFSESIPSSSSSIVRDENRVLWTNLTEERVRNSSELSLDFQDSLTNDGMSHMLKTLYNYGIILITNTPVEDDGSGVAALGAAVSGGAVKDSSVTSLLSRYLEHDGNETGMVMLPHGTDGPLRTLYGTVWSTTSSGQPEGASVADSAYGCDGLPLHTDMTYLRDPPGLQIFTMKEPAAIGGESVFGDGFAVAQRLRDTNPIAFQMLSKTIRTYRSIDAATGWHLQANGPIISMHNNGQVSMIRHNDLDRLPDLPPTSIKDAEEMNEFYHQLDLAHQAWDEILASDEFRCIMKLQPGDTVIVANQRCFHGRCSFQNPIGKGRSVIGCYISQDELYSRMRVEGYDII